MGLRDDADIPEVLERIRLAGEYLLGARRLTAAVRRDGLDDEERVRRLLFEQGDALLELLVGRLRRDDELDVEVLRARELEEARMRLPLRLCHDARQLDVHADDVGDVEYGSKLAVERAVRLKEDLRLLAERVQRFYDRADEGGVQQRLAAGEAHGLVRDFLQEIGDDSGRLRGGHRILDGLEGTRTSSRLDLADGMRARLILCVTVAAVEIAALEAHKDLAAADVLALPLYRGEDLDEVLVVCVHRQSLV